MAKLTKKALATARERYIAAKEAHAAAFTDQNDQLEIYNKAVAKAQETRAELHEASAEYFGMLDNLAMTDLDPPA